jgi:hypothetical protein
MERNISSIIGNSLEATNGIIGEVEDFYFDDEAWTVRYLIIKTGSWLSSRKVLISPTALKDRNWLNKIIPVNLTKEQLQNSPNIDTDQPVSRQQEVKLYRHYQWETYWGSGFYGGGSMGLNTHLPTIDRKVLIEPDKDHKRSNDDVHLRSTGRMTDYHMHASDGEIGHLNDFIIDDRTLQLFFFNCRYT